MKKSSWLSALIAMSLLIGLMSGCGDSGEKTIATVGDYDITLKEFNDFANQVRQPFATARDEFDFKHSIVDTLIINRLLIQEAYTKGIDKLEEIARVVLANKDKFLLESLYQRDITDKATVTEAEIKDFHNNLEYKIRASHVVVSDPDTADALLQRALDGENFEKLAEEYSIDPGAKRNKGDLGYFTWGASVDEFQEVAFKMEPGEISKPVKTNFGYHIIKLIDKQINDTRGEYATMKDMIERQITDRKRQVLTQDFLDRLQEMYTVVVDTVTVQFLEHKKTELYPPQLIDQLPKWGFDMEQLDRSEKELILASWPGDQMSLAEYLTQIERLPANVRPALTDTDSVAVIVFRMKMQDFLILEANKAGLENDPEVQRKLKLFKELSMAEIMRNDSLPKPLPPDEAMVRQYYDDNPEKFSEPAKVHVFEILLSDEIAANKLAREIKTLKEFKAKAKELTERPAKRGTNGDLDYIERKFFPEIFDLAKKTNNGSIGGPVVTSGGRYSIFWVVDKIEAKLMDYLQIKPQILQTLKNELNEQAFHAWVEQQRDLTNITINEDAIWATVDMDKYQTSETEEQASN